MKRTQFLLTSLAVMPLLAMTSIRKAINSPVKPFKVDTDKSRCNEVVTYREVNT